MYLYSQDLSKKKMAYPKSVTKKGLMKRLFIKSSQRGQHKDTRLMKHPGTLGSHYHL